MCFSFVESAANNLDLVKFKLNSASAVVLTNGIIAGNNQISSATTKKSFSTSLKISGISCNASSNSSSAPDIGEGNTTIASVTCMKDIKVDRAKPTSNLISSKFIYLV